MSLEIGPLPSISYGPAFAPASRPATGRFTPEPAPVAPPPRVDTAELSMLGPPPEEVRDAIAAAADRASELAAQNRELHFSVDEDSGRVIVEVRDFEGKIIRTIPPSEALAVMSGASV
jgi:flagellar protein FlaG